jgi:hypothetical protein
MKSLITLWKTLPLKCKGFPFEERLPDSPVQSYLKFSAVRGTTFLKSSITIFPCGLPPISISKNTLGLDGEDACEIYILSNNILVYYI